jgi:hypothetical protein
MYTFSVDTAKETEVSGLASLCAKSHPCPLRRPTDSSAREDNRMSHNSPCESHQQQQMSHGPRDSRSSHSQFICKAASPSLLNLARCMTSVAITVRHALTRYRCLEMSLSACEAAKITSLSVSSETLGRVCCLQFLPEAWRKCSSETSGNVYRSIGRYIPEESSGNLHLKWDMVLEIVASPAEIYIYIFIYLLNCNWALTRWQ